MKRSGQTRRKPQQDRSQEMVETILNAAEQIFGEVGFEKGTTRAVADRAGVSIGSIYQYYPDKFALLKSLKTRHIRSLWEAIGDACVKGNLLPWPEALSHLVATGLSYNLEHYPLYMQIQRQIPARFQGNDELMIPNELFIQRLRTFFCTHKQSMKVDVERAVSMCPIIARGIFIATISERPADLRNGRITRELTEILLGYLA